MSSAETFEVELKFRLPDDGRQILTCLTECGAVPQAVQQQVDRYFNHPARDFKQTDEALRIRSVDQQNWLTWKGPRIDSPTKTRPEIEVPLGPGEETARQFAEVLRRLGFQFVAEVRKQRQVFQLSRADGRFELALDTVAGIGAFLEIELLAAADELAAAQAAVLTLGEELGAGAITSRSYLAMVLERSGQAEATGE